MLQRVDGQRDERGQGADQHRVERFVEVYGFGFCGRQGALHEPLCVGLERKVDRHDAPLCVLQRKVVRVVDGTPLRIRQCHVHAPLGGLERRSFLARFVLFDGPLQVQLSEYRVGRCVVRRTQGDEHEERPGRGTGAA